MFRGDGTFAADDAGRERYWAIRDGRLLVCGDDGHLTMALERKPDGSWQGRWPVYGKGVCTDSLLRSLLAQARAAGAPVLVDPARGRDWRDYEGCTVIKANRIEAAEALGCHVDVPSATMARRLATRHRCHVVVTVGELGLWWSDGQKVRLVPAVPVQVRDVCGAGDTVLATLGMAIAAGGTLADGCRQAVRLAAEQVSDMGVRPVNRQSRQDFLPSRDLTCHGHGEHTVGTGLANNPTAPPGITCLASFRPFLGTENIYLTLFYGCYPAPGDVDRLIPFCCHALGRDWSDGQTERVRQSGRSGENLGVSSEHPQILGSGGEDPDAQKPLPTDIVFPIEVT